jgi:hypothetical protein
MGSHACRVHHPTWQGHACSLLTYSAPAAVGSPCTAAPVLQPASTHTCTTLRSSEETLLTVQQLTSLTHTTTGRQATQPLRLSLCCLASPADMQQQRRQWQLSSISSCAAPSLCSTSLLFTSAHLHCTALHHTYLSPTSRCTLRCTAHHATCQPPSPPPPPPGAQHCIHLNTWSRTRRPAGSSALHTTLRHTQARCWHALR